MAFLGRNKNFRLIQLILFIAVFCIIKPETAKAQFSYTIDGTVTNGKRKLEGANVTLLKGSTTVNQASTTSNGKFSFKLEPNANYTMNVSKPGYITKKFVFSTYGIPEDIAKTYDGGSKPEISIFEMPKDPSVVSQINSILSQPMAKFYYDDRKKDIIYDEAYSQSMKEALAKLSQIEKEAAQKADEEAKKQQQLESAAASQYEAAIIKGDAAFNKKDYVTARAAYEDALTVKKGEAYPLGKIKEIEKLQADAAKNAQIEADYKAAIAKADAALASKNYDFAKTNYNDALKIKPAEAYPKTKLAEIDALLLKEKSEKELNEKYAAAIAKGDAAFASKNYAASKTAYNDALTLKAAEKYPKDRIAEIDKLLADAANKEKAEKELNEKYLAAIAKGDKALSSKDYTNAKAGYNEALTLKSAEQYPKTKLAEIEKLLADAAAKEAAEKEKLAKEKELNDKYNAAIAKGDKAIGTKDYTNAKAGYNEAISLKSTEQYPKDKIKEIDAALAELASKDAAEKARLAKEKELNDKYNAAIAKADAAFSSKNYVAAKTSYSEASILKSAEQYPKDRIAEIDKLLADIAAKDAAEKDKLAKEKELNDKYNAAVAKGDKAFAAKTYDAAKSGYNEALSFKPNEQYPKDKITAIDKLLAELASKDAAEKERQAKEKELNEKYLAAVAKGDKAFAAKAYDEAKVGYNEALTIKPAEAYPKTKLAEIDKLLAEAAAKDAAEKARLAKEKELTEKYEAAIKKADADLASKNYEGAKGSYNEALTYKPTEKYPKDKIAEINAIIAKELGAKELEKKYADAIAKGDAAFGTKDYVNAKTQYNAALALKPSEQYPKDKLAQIEKLLADDAAEKARLAKEKELNDKYNAAIAKGDAALKLKTYDAAKSAYNEALSLKSSEQYPKDKIDEINKILAELAAKNASAKELDEKYKAAIAKGDKAFAAKTYEEAKAGYNEALEVKPAEAYPKTKLAEIDKLLADAASKDAAEKARLAKEKELAEKYEAAIKKADADLASKNYEGAKGFYNEALTYKPAEKYPKDKIAEINAILAKESGAKELEKKYTDAIAKADAFFGNKDYANAKTQYNVALGLKSGEQYPKDKIAEIDKLLGDANAEKERLAKEKELNAKYLAAITKGDNAFKLKTYDAAKSAYNEALTLKSNEQYPKDKIDEINKILAELAAKNASAKELDEKYKAAITKADASFSTKDYNGALASYNEASAIKPNEKYPKDKIAAINTILANEAGNKEKEEKYKILITKADEAFAAKEYTVAKPNYSEASILKPNEQYPKDQLVRVNDILASLEKNKVLQDKYEAAVKKADDLLSDKNYNAAITAYKEAHTIKPGEPYPSNKIAEINKKLESIEKAKAREQEYKDLIAKGDKLMLSKDYKLAKGAFQDALLIKASEQYPKTKIAEIDNLMKKGNTATTSTDAKKDEFKNALAEKYPEGITEESSRENNAKVTRRIVVKGKEGHLYVRKETSFGPIYYFKDDVPITEQEFIRDTEVQ